MTNVLVLGTRNAKKRQEIVEILGDLPLELRDLSSYPQAPEVDETGATFEANARKKAVELAKALQEWVLGEDSGLVVPALNDRPGVYSARYAGKQGDDAANNARLLAELASFPDDFRNAYYVCTAALADPAGEVRGVVSGNRAGSSQQPGRCWRRRHLVCRRRTVPSKLHSRSERARPDHCFAENPLLKSLGQLDSLLAASAWKGTAQFRPLPGACKYEKYATPAANRQVSRRSLAVSWRCMFENKRRWSWYSSVTFVPFSPTRMKCRIVRSATIRKHHFGSCDSPRFPSTIR